MSNQATLNNVPSSIVSPEALNVTTPDTPVTIPTENVTIPNKIDKESESLVSTRYLHLSKKEQALVKEREVFKKEAESFKKERESSKAEYEKYQKAWEMVNEIAELQKTNAVEAMRKAGFSETDAYNFLANQQTVQESPEDRATKAIQAELKKHQDAIDKKAQEESSKQTELQKQQEEQIIVKFKEDINNHLSVNSDKYEYLNFYGKPGQDLVYDTVEAIIADSDPNDIQDANELLTEAADLVENYYEELDKSMNSLKKRKPLEPVKPIVEAQSQSILDTIRSSKRVESKNFVDNKIPTKTLSNKTGPTLPSSVPSSLNHEQNKQQIIDKYTAMFKK